MCTAKRIIRILLSCKLGPSYLDAAHFNFDLTTRIIHAYQVYIKPSQSTPKLVMDNHLKPTVVPYFSRDKEPKRVTFASEQIIAPFHGKMNSCEGLNQNWNILLRNVLPQGSKLNTAPPQQSTENKENENEKMALLNPNYRLLYHLHSERKDMDNSDEMWQSIAKSYNFLSNSKHTSAEMVKLWKRVPAMTKRKIELDSLDDLESSDETTNHNKKKSCSNKNNAIPEDKNVEEKPQIVSILKNATMPSAPASQREPFDFSKKQKSKLPKTSKAKSNENVESDMCNETNPLNVGTQTDSTESKDQKEKDESEYRRKEYKLKMAMLEIKKKYVHLQYKKHLGEKHGSK